PSTTMAHTASQSPGRIGSIRGIVVTPRSIPQTRARGSQAASFPTGTYEPRASRPGHSYTNCQITSGARHPWIGEAPMLRIALVIAALLTTARPGYPATRASDPSLEDNRLTLAAAYALEGMFEEAQHLLDAAPDFIKARPP